MSRKKILIVDDSQTVLLMERMILGRGPYEVITASNGQEGVAKAQSESPDLILMDVIMPVMSGFEALKELRANAVSTPVIMVTTRGEEENVEIGYAAGCNDYITKPINAPELLEKVRSLLTV